MDLLKAHPDWSDRRIAGLVGRSPTTVGKERRKLAAQGLVSRVRTRTDKRGREQPAGKPKRKRRDSRGLDCYWTPPAAVHALLEVEKFTGAVWEPACGSGNVVGVLRDAGHHVVATDVADYGCPDAEGGVDFLKVQRPPKGVQTVITNPPYKWANEFVRHALKLVPRVVMLLPLGFLSGLGRSDIIDSGQLARVYVFRNRLPNMHRDGWEGPHASNKDTHAWFVWERGHVGRPAMYRITCEK